MPFLRSAYLPLVLCVFLCDTTKILAQQSISKELQVKALFLYNFTQFVEWPREALRDNEPLVIGIVGSDPFGPYIDELVHNEVINGHQLVVERYTPEDDLSRCHILYINFRDKDKLRSIVDPLQSRAVLTISDADNFTRIGGVIRFLNEKGRIRIRINVGAASNAQLIISSKLLRLSEIVTGKNN